MFWYLDAVLFATTWGNSDVVLLRFVPQQQRLGLVGERRLFELVSHKGPLCETVLGLTLVTPIYAKRRVS